MGGCHGYAIKKSTFRAMPPPKNGCLQGVAPVHHRQLGPKADLRGGGGLPVVRQTLHSHRQTQQKNAPPGLLENSLPLAGGVWSAFIRRWRSHQARDAPSVQRDGPQWQLNVWLFVGIRGCPEPGGLHQWGSSLPGPFSSRSSIPPQGVPLQ